MQQQHKKKEWIIIPRSDIMPMMNIHQDILIDHVHMRTNVNCRPITIDDEQKDMLILVTDFIRKKKKKCWKAIPDVFLLHLQRCARVCVCVCLYIDNEMSSLSLNKQTFSRFSSLLNVYR